MTHRIGLIGVGIIGEPVIRGLIRAHGENVDVRLSPRNAERAARLASEFPNVRVETSNQAVVDGSDWVILAVLGPVAEEIIRALRFRPDHRVVSLLAGAYLPAIREWTGLDAVTRMVPLPYVAHGAGPVATYPLTPEVEAVFGKLGTLVGAEDEAGLNAMSMITSTQSGFFAMLAEVAAWGQHHGLAPETSQEFTIAFYSALLSKGSTLTPEELADHWQEMTPGGYNYTAVTTLAQAGAINAWTDALDAVHHRLQNET